MTSSGDCDDTSPSTSPCNEMNATEASVSAPRDAATGQASGKRQHTPVQVKSGSGTADPSPAEATNIGSQASENGGTSMSSTRESSMPSVSEMAPTSTSSNAASSSVQSPRDVASGQATGKRVATGDVNGDGAMDETVAPRDVATGQATGKRQHKPVSYSSGTGGASQPAGKLKGNPCKGCPNLPADIDTLKPLPETDPVLK